MLNLRAIRLIPAAAVVMFGVGLTLGSASSAQAKRPTMAEAIRFARSELNKLCDDKDRSFFNVIDDRPVRRSCTVSLSRGRLVMRVAYQYKTDISDARTPFGSLAKLASFRIEDSRSGSVTLDIDFDRYSMFICGPRRKRGYAPLYLNCFAESSTSNKICVNEEIIAWTNDGNRLVERNEASYAKLVNLTTKDCERISKALNFVARRSERRESPRVRDYFSD